MAVTTNQATVVCQSGCQPLIRSPLRRGGKTGAFNALEQYGTGAQWHSSSVQEISANVGLRGGAQRTRTISQNIMPDRAAGDAAFVSFKHRIDRPSENTTCQTRLSHNVMF